MWLVNRMVNLFPGLPAHHLCNKHLNSVLAEYNNLLMPSMRKGNSIKGYVDHGCVDLEFSNARIIECVNEYKARGLDWHYKIPTPDDIKLHEKYREMYQDLTPERRKEMAEMNIRILAFRCPECKTRLLERACRKI